MAVQVQSVDALATLTVWLRRGETETATEGVRSVLDAVDAVTALDDVEVTGVRPLANELRLDADVALTVRVAASCDDSEVAARERLADGFGVTDVATLRVDADR
jgi:hypothetical protein